MGGVGRRHRLTAFAKPIPHQRDLVPLRDDDSLGQSLDVGAGAMTWGPAGNFHGLGMVGNHPRHELDVGRRHGALDHWRRGRGSRSAPGAAACRDHQRREDETGRLQGHSSHGFEPATIIRPFRWSGKARNRLRSALAARLDPSISNQECSVEIDRRRFLQAAAVSAGTMAAGCAKQDAEADDEVPAAIRALKPMTDGVVPISDDERKQRIDKAQQLMAGRYQLLLLHRDAVGPERADF